MRGEFHIPEAFVDAVAEAVVKRLRPMIHGLGVLVENDDGLMSLKELAEYLGVSKDWIYQRTAKNEIPFGKVGRFVKFRRSEIDRWLSTRSVPAVTPLSALLPERRARD